jgi:hypothetical protein
MLQRGEPFARRLWPCGLTPRSAGSRQAPTATAPTLPGRMTGQRTRHVADITPVNRTFESDTCEVGLDPVTDRSTGQLLLAMWPPRSVVQDRAPVFVGDAVVTLLRCGPAPGVTSPAHLVGNKNDHCNIAGSLRYVLAFSAAATGAACRSFSRYALRQRVASQGCLSRSKPGGR